MLNGIFLRGILLRYGVSVIALLDFLLFAWLHQNHPPLYLTMQNIMDGAAVPRPFGDLHAILQAASCWRQGVNIYAPSPCMGGGVYNYSLLLLKFLYILPAHDTNTAAIVIDLLYIGAFSCLPKPCSGNDFVLRTLAALSGASIFAAERANLDLVIFLLAFGGLFFLLRGLAGKLFGYAVFILLAVAKFYPLTLLLLAVRERPIVLYWLAPMVLAGASAFMASQGGDVATVARILPRGNPFVASFGSVNLFYGLASLNHQTGGTAQPFSFYLTGWQKLLLHFMQLASIALALLRRRYYQGKVEMLDASRKNLAVAGAATIAGCFLIAQNNDYRAIFLIWTIPALAWLAQQPAPAGRPSLRVLWAIIFVMWAGFFQYSMTRLGHLCFTGVLLYFAFCLLREAIWWWLAVQLIAILFALLQPDLKRILDETKLTAIGRRG